MLVTLHVIICGLLIVVIMLQSGEAADLAGAFGGAGSQTAFGPRGAATFLSKATTWCAIMFMLTSMALTMHQNSTVGVNRQFRAATVLEDVQAAGARGSCSISSGISAGPGRLLLRQRLRRRNK